MIKPRVRPLRNINTMERYRISYLGVTKTASVSHYENGKPKTEACIRRELAYQIDKLTQQILREVANCV